MKLTDQLNKQADLIQDGLKELTQLLREAIDQDVNDTALVSTLVRLIRMRIDVLNAFELLMRIDGNRAQQVLLDLYVGKDVDPDTKYGGFTSELSIMMSDLVDFYGVKSIVQIIRSEFFDKRLLKDARFAESIVFAAEMPLDEFMIHQGLEELNP